MKQKILGLVSLFFLASFLSSLLFVTTSKSPDDLEFSDDCDNIEGKGDNVRIQINVDQYSFSQYRSSTYQNYIPTPDLRTSGSPGGVLSEHDKYYCFVTVTCPQCEDWIWEEALSTSNSNGTGKMNIKIPPEGYDATIEVEYYEVTDDPPQPPFNSSALVGNRLKYKFEQTYQNGFGNSVPQPVFPAPVGLKIFGTDASGWNKEFVEMEDYSGVNEYINLGGYKLWN